jgi:hypothetical protein
MIVLLLGGVLSGQIQEPVGLCEVLRNLESYNGKIVTVRAFVTGGSRHGYYLVDNKKQIPCPSMPNSKADWPPTIDLSWPGSAGLEPTPLPFDRDTAAQEKFYDSIRKLEQQTDPERVMQATFVGQIRTRRSISIFHNKVDDVYAGNGYGQFGMHPGRLVIKTVLDITIE